VELRHCDVGSDVIRRETLLGNVKPGCKFLMSCSCLNACFCSWPSFKLLPTFKVQSSQNVFFQCCFLSKSKRKNDLNKKGYLRTNNIQRAKSNQWLGGTCLSVSIVWHRGFGFWNVAFQPKIINSCRLSKQWERDTDFLHQWIAHKCSINSCWNAGRRIGTNDPSSDKSCLRSTGCYVNLRSWKQSPETSGWSEWRRLI